METLWKCSGVDCDDEAITGWFVPEPRLVCKEHHEQLADRAPAIPTEDGRLIVKPLAQQRNHGQQPLGGRPRQATWEASVRDGRVDGR
jgi:hypothetical protein